MTVSIVIPTYNGAAYLADTIRSVQAQTVPDWEMVIVDDGSQDGTWSLIEKYMQCDPRIRGVRQPNGGESTARNRGLAETNAGYPYVIFLDHDDMWEPDALRSLQNALESRPSAVGAYGSGRFVDQDGAPCLDGHLEAWCRRRKRWDGRRFVDCKPDDMTTLDTVAYHPSIPTPGVCLLRRTLLPSGCLFKPEMRTGSGDIHLWMRLARHHPFVFIDVPLIRGRRHGTNMTNDRRKIARSMMEALRDVLSLPDTSNAQRRMLSLGYRHCWRDVSRDQTRSSLSLATGGELALAVKELGRAIRNYWRSMQGPPR